MHGPGVEPAISRSQVRRPNHYTAVEPVDIVVVEFLLVTGEWRNGHVTATGAFVFGMLMTMIFVDVTKLMTGRLRPTFIPTCRPNWTLCISGGLSKAADVCLETDTRLLRTARLSFPSMQAAVTAFSACYVAVSTFGDHDCRSFRLTFVFN